MILNTINVHDELYILFFGFFVLCFFLNFWFFCFFLDFLVCFWFITAVASLLHHSLLLFSFTYRWSTVHRTWGTVLRHVRVPTSSDLLCGKLNAQVADAAEVNCAALKLYHLASWGTRWGPCGLVIKAPPHRAPGSISQFKLLLQESLIWNYEKVN